MISAEIRGDWPSPQEHLKFIIQKNIFRAMWKSQIILKFRRAVFCEMKLQNGAPRYC